MIKEVNGQPIGRVMRMVQDQAGFLWLGTNNGLLRFDGKNIKTFVYNKHDPNSLISNFILTLAFDGQYIWIGTSDGLSRFNPQTEQFINFRTDPKADNGLSSNVILSLSLDDNNGLWLATQQGIRYLDRNTLKITKQAQSLYSDKAADSSSIRAILKDKQQRLWYSVTRQGLHLYEQKTQKITRFEIDSTDPTKLDSPHIESIFQSKDGTIWIGSALSLLRFDEQHRHFVRYPVDRRNSNSAVIVDIAEDKEGTLWLSTLFNGISYLTKGAEALANLNDPNTDPNSITTETVEEIFIDNNGTFWLSQQFNGLSKLQPIAQQWQHWSTKAPSIAVSAMVTDKDSNTWLTANNHLYRLTDKQITKVKTDIGKTEVMILTPEHSLLLKTEKQGLILYNPKTSKTRLHPANDRIPGSAINSLTFDRQNNLWIGMAYADGGTKGIYQIDATTNQLLFSNTEYWVEDILVTEQGILLAAKSQGILHLTEKDGTYQIAELFPEQTRNTLHLLQDSEGRIWFTTKDKGLGRLSLTPLSVEFIDLGDGMPSNFLSAIIQDKQGRLWISAIDSLAVFMPQTKHINLFGHKQGAYFAQYLAELSSITPQGELLFATGKGLVKFHPSQLLATEPPQQYSILLSDFRLLNKPVKLSPSSPLNKAIAYTKALTLSHEDYLFSLTLSSSNLGDQEQARFSYRMLGYRNDWIETDATNRTISYTSLSPGDYELQVKTTRSDGSWSDKYRSLNITITPPWYRTNLAWVIYVLLTLTALFLFIRLREQRLLKQAKQLEQTVQERTEQLQQSRDQVTQLLDQKEKHFANISHEFKTPLTLILSPLESLLSMSKSQLKFDELRRKHQMMKRNGSRLLRMVEQMLALSRLDSAIEQNQRLYSLKNTLNTLLTSFQPLIERKSLSLEINDFDDVMLLLKSDSLEMILTNLISNAIKYTPEGGNICVEVAVNGSDVTLMVKDSGPGISEQNQALIFDRFTRVEESHTENIPGAGIGLALVKELVESHQGTVGLQSQLGQGSCFSVTLPICSESNLGKETQTELSETLQMEVDALTESEVAVPIAAESSGPDTTKPSILVIDDNQDMLQLLQETLSPHFDCSCANNGEQGLQMAHTQVPDIIISDVMMPGISGYEVAKRLKDDELTCHIPVILLTAKGDIDSRMEGWKQDIDEYLNKPFHPQELILRVENLLSVRTILRKRFAKQLEHTAPADNQVLSGKDAQFIEKFNQSIEQNHQDYQFNRAACAKNLGISERQLSRKLGALMNDSFSELLRDFRLSRALELFKTGQQISQISDDVGFNNLSYFCQCFKAKYGKTPTQYQKEVIFR